MHCTTRDKMRAQRKCTTALFRHTARRCYAVESNNANAQDARIGQVHPLHAHTTMGDVQVYAYASVLRSQAVIVPNTTVWK